MGGYAEKDPYELNGSHQSPRLSHHPVAVEFTCCRQRWDIHGKESHTKPGVLLLQHSMLGTRARECSLLKKRSFKALAAARGWCDARSGHATAPCQAVGRTWSAEPVVLLRRGECARIASVSTNGAEIWGLHGAPGGTELGTCQDSEEGPAPPSLKDRFSWSMLVYRASSTVQKLIQLMWETDFSLSL